MEKVWHLFNQLQLLACVLVPIHQNVYGCLLELNPVSPQSFLFTAVPSINAFLGEKLELKCSVDGTNSTSILESISVHSRSQGKLNITCSMFKNKSGECRYTIPTVQLWHRGSYDCIKFYKDKQCFSKTLQLSVSQRPTLPSLTKESTSESTRRDSSDPGSTTPTSGATRTMTSLNNGIVIFISFVLLLIYGR